jgi:hypothetical protein
MASYLTVLFQFFMGLPDLQASLGVPVWCELLNKLGA